MSTSSVCITLIFLLRSWFLSFLIWFLLNYEEMESDLGKLFIGGISWDTDEEHLKEYFRGYGEVEEAVIMRDRATARARGFGFVVFADPAVANRVIMDKHMINGRTVEAKKAIPRDDQNILNRNTSSIHDSPGPGHTKKIFVGGLASTVTESDFKKYFDQFGIITDAVVMYDHNTQRPRGFGFITYHSEEAVDRVLHKSFHELNGKMVEVKRAVPKELSPGPSRSPMIGCNNFALNRASNLDNSFAQRYNLSPVGGFGVRMNGRFNPLASGRGGFSPFSATGYGMGMNLEVGLSPSYGGSTIGNSLGYGRMLSPYQSGTSNRYSTPIGFGGESGRSDSVLSSTTWNVWGNGGLNNVTNPTSPGAYLGSGSGSFRVSYGNSGANWGPVSVPAAANASGYSSGSMGYGSGDGSYGLGAGGFARNSNTGVGTASSLTGSTVGYDRSYGDLYRPGSIYGDSTWQSATSELDGSVSFSYGLDSISTDVAARSSEGYIGSYNVTNRQSNRGIAT